MVGMAFFGARVAERFRPRADFDFMTPIAPSRSQCLVNALARQQRLCMI